MNRVMLRMSTGGGDEYGRVFSRIGRVAGCDALMNWDDGHFCKSISLLAVLILEHQGEIYCRRPYDCPPG